MKKRILALLLLAALVITALPVFAVEAASAWAANGTTVTEAGDGYYSISGIQYETTAYTAKKVKLDGLTIEMKIADFVAGQATGVLFSAAPNATYSNGTAVAMTLWCKPYTGEQSRFHVGANHDYNGASYAYTDATCTTAGFKAAASMVLNTVSNGDIKIEINSHDENTYAVKFTIAQDNLLWGSNCNYADEAEGGHSCTFYMKKSTFESALDADGKLYVSAAGLKNPNYSIRVTEAGTVVTSVTGSKNNNWEAYAGSPVVSFTEDGYTAVSNLTGWGARAYYKQLVKLDGLELSFRATTNLKDCVGIVFASTKGAYFGDGSNFAITYWNELYSGQARLHFGTDHNHNAESVVHTAPDITSKKGFGVATSMVCNQAPTMGWTIKFESYNDEFYSVKITMTDSTMWGNNANYNAVEKSCTVYLPKASVADMLNENGECYIIAAGFPTGTNPACSAEYKLIGDNYSAKITTSSILNLTGQNATVHIAGDYTKLSVVDTGFMDNGFDLSGKNAGKLMLDAESTGKIKDYVQYGDYKYLKVQNDDGTYSFHPFNLAITKIGLNTQEGHESICIEVQFIANDVVRDKFLDNVNNYGIKNITTSGAYIPAKDNYGFGEVNGVKAYFDLKDSLTDITKFTSTFRLQAYMMIDGVEILSNYVAEITPSDVWDSIIAAIDAGEIVPTEAQASRINRLQEGIQKMRDAE